MQSIQVSCKDNVWLISSFLQYIRYKKDRILASIKRISFLYSSKSIENNDQRLSLFFVFVFCFVNCILTKTNLRLKEEGILETGLLKKGT